MSITQVINPVEIALAYLEGLGPVQALQVCHALKAAAEQELRQKTKFLDLTPECGQCQAITKAGTRCTFAGKRSGFCGRHYVKNQTAIASQYALLTTQDWQRIIRTTTVMQADKTVDQQGTIPVWTLNLPVQAKQMITPPRPSETAVNWRKPAHAPARRVLFTHTIPEDATVQPDAFDALDAMLDHKHDTSPSQTQVITTVERQITRVRIPTPKPAAPVPIPGTCGAHGGITQAGLPCRRQAKPGQRCFSHRD
jgi:hypothetical protein